MSLPSGEDVPDGQLLERYVKTRDQTAFSALVHRYAALVYGVCRRVLHDSHAADDAFQATFLVLVRRASVLDRRGTLANWLYTVAYRTALKARANAARLRAHERQAADMPAPQHDEEAHWKELRPLLDEELHQLPEKYRAPLVLCYLEGKTHQQAARLLGWPIGSVSRRMARARELLRQRLTHRGVVFSASLLFALMAKKSAVAAPATLVTSTVKAAVLFGAGATAASGVASAQVAALAQEMLKVIGVTNLKFIPPKPLLLLLLLIFGSGATLGATIFITAVGHPPPCKAVVTVKPLHGQAVTQLEVPGEVLALASTPDGKTLITGERSADPSIRLWDAETGVEQGRLGGHAGAITSLALAPDGRTLASTGQDGAVKIWDLAARVERRLLRIPAGEALVVVFSPDGRTVSAGTSDCLVQSWDVATGTPRTTWAGHKGAVTALAYAPDGKTVASGSADGSVKLWNVAEGRERASLALTSKGVTSLAFAPNSILLAIGTGDRAVQLWDAALVRYWNAARAESEPVHAVAFSPGGTHLFFAGSEATVRVWELAARDTAAVLEGHSAPVNAMTFLGGAKKLATASSDRTVKVWRLDP
jgi:RNA polymerase sigma factor (sigma-70 family)